MTHWWITDHAQTVGPYPSLYMSYWEIERVHPIHRKTKLPKGWRISAGGSWEGIIGMQIQAPWTDEQVIQLNRYQDSGYFHPFTCPDQRKLSHNQGQQWLDTNLIAINEGWICPVCDYTQNWAHEGMMQNWSDFNPFPPKR